MTASFAELKFNWSLTERNHTDVVPEGHCINSVEDVYLLKLPVAEAVRPGSTSFASAFDRNDHVQVYYEATLQLILKVVAEMRAAFAEEVASGEPALTECIGDPVQVYLESVVSTKPDTALVNAGLLANADRTTIDRRPFLTGVGDEFPIVEYRVWVFVRARSEKFDFDRIFAETVATLNRQYRVAFGKVSETKGRKKGRKDAPDDSNVGNLGGEGTQDKPVDMCSFTGDSAGIMQYGQSLGDTDKWRLLRSESTWCQVADLILGYEYLTRPEMLAKLATRSMVPDSNPAHPRYILSPFMYFRMPHEYADASQRRVRGYIVGGPDTRTWTFPVANRVLRIPVADEVIHRFRLKLMPEYQARSMHDLDENLTKAVTAKRRVCAEKYFDEFQRPTSDNAEMPSMYEDAMEDGAGDTDVLGFDLDDGGPGSGAATDAFGNPIGDDASVAPAVAVVGGTAPDQIRAMLNACLPQRQELVAYDSRALLREDFEDSQSLMQQHLLATTDSPDRSAFHALRFRGAKMRARLNAAAAAAGKEGGLTREELNEQRKYLQYKMLQEYESTCMSSSSDVSRPGTLINRWYETRVKDGKAWLGQDAPKIDGSMSTLANMIARRLFRYESAMFMANMHGVALTLSFGTLDAYRHELALHWNAVLTGDRATSKSFTIDLLQNLRIPETVVLVGSKTGKADYIDRDQNDQIMINHELNPEAFRTKSKGGDDKQEAELKDYLTSQVRTIKAFAIDKMGRRLNRTAYSQQIGAYIGCSNMDDRFFSGAIHSRMSCINCVERYRKDRHPADLADIDKQIGAGGIVRQMLFREELCAEQFFHYHVEKNIGTHALTDVTLACWLRIRQVFTRHLRSRYLITVPLRAQQRISMMVRKLVISQAAEFLYSSPASKYWKQPFSVYQLADFDPLLRDTEEICYMAIDMHRHEIMSGNRALLIKALYTRCVVDIRRRVLADTTIAAPDSRLQACYLTPYTAVSIGGFDAGRPSGRGGLASSQQFGRNRSFELRAAPSSAPTSVPGETMASELWPAEYMYAYMRVDGSVSAVARGVADWTKNTSTVITEDQARAGYYDLCKESIQGQRYRWNEETHEPEPLANTDAITMPAALQTPRAMFIHLDLVGDEDPVEETIRRCFSSLLPEKRRYMGGQCGSTERPQKFRVRDVLPEDGHEQYITDFANEVTQEMELGYHFADGLLSTGGGSATRGPQRMTMHYDEISRRARADALYLDPEDPAACSFDVYEDYAVAPVPQDHALRGTRQRLYCLDTVGAYPDTLKRGVPTAPPLRKRKLPPTFDQDEEEEEEDEYEEYTEESE